MLNLRLKSNKFLPVKCMLFDFYGACSYFFFHFYWALCDVCHTPLMIISTAISFILVCFIISWQTVASFCCQVCSRYSSILTQSVTKWWLEINDFFPLYNFRSSSDLFDLFELSTLNKINSVNSSQTVMSVFWNYTSHL